MIASEGEIIRKLKQVIGNQEVWAKYGIIKSVDKDKQTCEVYQSDNKEIIYTNVKLGTTAESNYIAYPKVGSNCIINFISDTQAYIACLSEVEGYYISNADNSFLDIMVDFITAIKNMTILTNQGASLNNGIINIADFQAVEDKLKNLFLK